MASEATFRLAAQASDFRPGERVKLIPKSAAGDAHHPDCQTGIVSSVNSTTVFVRFYWSALGTTRTSTRPIDPADLIKQP
jgi:hypothetical protein